MTEPETLICDDCKDDVPEDEGCRCDGHVFCGSCFVRNCRECADDLRDAMRAEAASDR